MRELRFRVSDSFVENSEGGVTYIKVNRAHQGRLACAKDGKMLYDSVYHRRVRYPCGRHARSMPLGLFSLTHAHRRASIVTPLYAHIYTVYYTPYIFEREDGVYAPEF